MQETLWYNSFIKSNGKMIFCKKMHSKGISTVRDIYDACNGKFFEYEILVYNYGEIDNFLIYNKVIKCIPNDWKDKLRYDDGKEGDDRLQILNNDYKITKQMYWNMIEIKMSTYDHGWLTWQHELKTTIDKNTWEKYRLHGFTVSMSTKLSTFSI